jgi:hypothetical protein
MTDDTSDDDINFERRIASSLTEIGQHIADETETDVMSYRRLAERYFIEEYCRNHSDVFTQNGRLDWVYKGTPPKGYLPPAYDDDAEETPDEEKVQFPDDDAPEADL